MDGDWQMDYGFREQPEYRRKSSAAGRIYYDYLLHSRVVQGAVLVVSLVIKQAKLKQLDRTWLWEPGIDARVYAPPVAPEWVAAWEATRQLVRLVQAETRVLDAGLRVLALNTGAQVYPKPEPAATMAERLGVLAGFQWTFVLALKLFLR